MKTLFSFFSKKKIILIAACIAIAASVFIFYTPRASNIRHLDTRLREEIDVKVYTKRARRIPLTPKERLDLAAILSQPFFYHAKGKQCYVFASADGKYVIKFLMRSRLQMPDIPKEKFRFFSFTNSRRVKKKARKKRLRDMCTSFYLSITRVTEETGTVFVHLRRSLHEEVQLVDKYSKIFPVNLKKTAFILQKRARLIKPEIIRLVHEEQQIAVRKRLEQIVDLLATCAKKGIWDIDSGLIRNNNIGFLEDRAIYIDTGRLISVQNIDKRAYFIEDLKRLRPLHKWLEAYYPELDDYLTEVEYKAIEHFDD